MGSYFHFFSYFLFSLDYEIEIFVKVCCLWSIGMMESFFCCFYLGRGWHGINGNA